MTWVISKVKGDVTGDHQTISFKLSERFPLQISELLLSTFRKMLHLLELQLKE